MRPTCGSPGLARTRRRLVALAVALALGRGAAAGAEEISSVLGEAVAERPALASLLTDHTFHRRVVATGRVLDRDLHEFLLSHPDIGARLAALQGLGGYHVERVGPRRFAGTDGDGASATLEILREAPGLRVFHARGVQTLRLLPDVSGEALVVLTTRYEEGAGAEVAHGELSIYARLDNRLLGALLQLLLPLVGGLLDEKIARAFLSESRAVELLLTRRETVLAGLASSNWLRRRDVETFQGMLDRALERLEQAPVLAARGMPAADAAGPAPLPAEGPVRSAP